MPAVPELDPDLDLAQLPQLRALAWHVAATEVVLTPQEAFALYERNWRHLDRAALTPYEAHVIEQLVRSVGKGVLLV